MKPLYALVCAGFLMIAAPGCCILESIFCWGGGYGYSPCGGDPCGCGWGHRGHGKHSKKCAKHCRKCAECTGDGYVDGFGGSCGCGGSMIGDCGCGGIIGDVGGGCGLGGHGPMPGPGPGPGPIPPIPGVQQEVAPPPPGTTSMSTVPSGMTQVSVEEFQRLPGVVVSGPTPQQAAPQLAGQPAVSSTPAAVSAPPDSNPTPASTAARMQSVQQASWIPTRQ